MINDIAQDILICMTNIKVSNFSLILYAEYFSLPCKILFKG